MFLLFCSPFSNFMFFGYYFSSPFYHLPPNPTAIELVLYFINRADTLFFLLTITLATLYTTGFGKKELLYKFSIYCFVVSMIFLSITSLQMLVGLPYRY